MIITSKYRRWFVGTYTILFPLSLYKHDPDRMPQRARLRRDLPEHLLWYSNYRCSAFWVSIEGRLHPSFDDDTRREDMSHGFLFLLRKRSFISHIVYASSCKPHAVRSIILSAHFKRKALYVTIIYQPQCLNRPSTRSHVFASLPPFSLPEIRRRNS
jgi:hypothetical protein